MPVLPRLVEAYTFEGYAVLSGLNPTHYKSFPGVPFTWIRAYPVDTHDHNM
jgi:hypothetical protein